MRGLTLTQPWATLVAIGAKSIETRSWATSYRGLVAIHAAKGLADMSPATYTSTCASEPFRAALRPHYAQPGDLPFGAIVAVAQIVACLQITPTGMQARGTTRPLPPEPERSFGNYAPGRYAWLLADVRRLPAPIPYRGALSLWIVPTELKQRILIAAQLEEE